MHNGDGRGESQSIDEGAFIASYYVISLLHWDYEADVCPTSTLCVDFAPLHTFSFDVMVPTVCVDINNGFHLVGLI